MTRDFIVTLTVQKIKLSIKDYFGKRDQIRRKLRIWWKLQIWSHLLKKSLMENFIFDAVSLQIQFMHIFQNKGTFCKEK